MAHHLNVQPEACLIKQKKRCMAPEQLKHLEEEVDTLLEAGFIREVQYLEWLANIVMVKKANEK